MKTDQEKINSYKLKLELYNYWLDVLNKGDFNSLDMSEYKHAERRLNNAIKKGYNKLYNKAVKNVWDDFIECGMYYNITVRR